MYRLRFSRRVIISGIAILAVLATSFGCRDNRQKSVTEDVGVTHLGPGVRGPSPQSITQRHLISIRGIVVVCFSDEIPATFQEMLSNEEFRRQLEEYYGHRISSPADITDYWGSPISINRNTDVRVSLQSPGENRVLGDHDDIWYPTRLNSETSSSLAEEGIETETDPF